MSAKTVLVVGGCGFVGYHIVNAFIQDSAWSSIHVMSRNPSRNQVEGAHYHSGSLTSFEQVRSLLADIQPSLIIHTASPIGSGSASDSDFYDINVKGTKNLLKAAIASDHVRSFIYTSSVEVMEGSSHIFLTEDGQMYTITSRAEYYAKTKAIADQAVLDANGMGGLRTLCIRLAVVYGERDSQLIPGTLHALQEGRHRYQIGDNQSLFDYVSATNVAQSHLLAAKALLRQPEDGSGKVDGEAFFITDGNPVPFWTFLRQIWSAAGDRTAPEEVTVVPAWFMLSLASAVEWLFWAFTLGLKRPKVLRRQIMTYACRPRTYSIEKARERLGYKPLDDRDEQIRTGVDWASRMHKEEKEAA
ncbi:hypothetical protein HO173_003088 [Letharia columbiana]|uniref:3-beta hydroxysteroid dehydrogenase/isomerase domain-containing protein n=1 Tax=Letharia columbiana TaxID=112416 RepID=A0A8H6G143_9LECA|nr:uncharacterized protein HO173_003088 [Letharia columbiana]KAF6238583.1 hypothetical protein HO173_003088 [Letharia columbiana]